MAVNDFIQSARDPFFSPRRFQQNPTFDWSATPVVSGPGGYLEQNPEALWTRYLAGRGVGLGSRGALADYLRNQRGNMQAGFQAAVADDPTLTFQRYLGSVNYQDLLDTFNRLAPSQRGENWSRYAGPSRWLSDL